MGKAPTLSSAQSPLKMSPAGTIKNNKIGAINKARLLLQYFTKKDKAILAKL